MEQRLSWAANSNDITKAFSNLNECFNSHIEVDPLVEIEWNTHCQKVGWEVVDVNARASITLKLRIGAIPGFEKFGKQNVVVQEKQS